VAPKKVQKKRVVSKKTAKTAKVVKKPASRLGDEITGLLIAVLGIIMMLSIYFSGAAGPFGELVGRFTGGLFGFMGYAIPLVTFIYGIIAIFKPKTPSRGRKLLLLLILISLISALLQAGLHEIAFYQNMNVSQYITSFYKEGLASVGKTNGEFLASGGVIGGVIGVPLLFVFKKLGTMIILVTLAIIAAMVLTRLSLADAAKGVYRGTSEAINGMVVAMKKKREERGYAKGLDEPQVSLPPMREVNPQSARRKSKILDFPLVDAKPDMSPSQDHAVNGFVLTEEPAGPAAQMAAANPEMDVKPARRSRKQPQAAGEEAFTITEPAKAASPAKAGNPAEEVAAETEFAISKSNAYIFPPVELLKKSSESDNNMNKIKSAAVENAKKLEATLESFGVGAKVINVSVGPAFTRYELQPALGVKVSRIVNLTDDIALNLASSGVRIEAPIPGKAAIGIEIPNKEVAPIGLRSVLEAKEFQNHSSHLAVALGKDISGDNVVIDLAKMPHILIAGATGSGKSVCINSIVVSILYKASPDDVKLLMIDPKVVELGVYNGIPHLLIPVVTDPNKAAGALRWAVSEMTTRYKLFADRGVRDLLGYNASIDEAGEGTKLPQMVIIIDELADLMMVAPHDVEDSICRLAQMARAAGMHLVIATQRPSVNVITGVIKANIPSRIAFAVSSQVDSRTILDMAGAEKLLGKGDMLYYPVGIPKPIRVKGAFVTDKEVELAVDFVKNQVRVHYDEDIIENINEDIKKDDEEDQAEGTDELLNQAIDAVIDCGQASVSFIQRKFKVGYARAGRIIDQMTERNIISGYEGSKPRRILVTRERWEEMKLSSSGDHL
jgi:S-DNA-T family DNA segregation ATPase FtsK/SpoIIIE